MAVVGRDALMDRLKAVIGEEMSDDHLSLLEDFSDSWGDMEAKASANHEEEWKKKYEDNDAEWRKRYRDRFFGRAPAGEETKAIDVKESSEESTEDGSRETTIQIEDLFKEE